MPGRHHTTSKREELDAQSQAALDAIDTSTAPPIAKDKRLDDPRLTPHRALIMTARTTTTAVGEALPAVEEFKAQMQAKPLARELHPLALKFKAKNDAMAGSPDEMRRTAITAEMTGRIVAAGTALFALRNWHSDRMPSELAKGEETWRDYANARLPFGHDRAEQIIGIVCYRGGSLHCPECGMQALCPCGCGAPYLPDLWKGLAKTEPEAKPPEPTKLELAIAAVREHPEKTLRDIAEEIGVSHEYVRKARRELAEQSQPVDKQLTPETRVGRDGKTYHRVKAQPEGGIGELFPEGSPACDVDWESYEPDAGAFQHRRAFKWQILEAERLAVESALRREGAKVNKTDIKAVRKVARHWLELAKQLETVRRKS